MQLYSRSSCAESASQAEPSPAALSQDTEACPFRKYQCVSPVTQLLLVSVFVVFSFAVFAFPGFVWMLLATHTFADAAVSAVSDAWCLTFDALFWATASITLFFLLDHFNPPIETETPSEKRI